MSLPKILKGIVLPLAGLAILFIAICYVVGGIKMAKKYDVTGKPFTLSTDSTTLAYGAHLTKIYGCQECHASNFEGKIIVDVPWLAGRIVASNLTSGRGGKGTLLKEMDWDRAIRHGVKHDGTALLYMPSDVYKGLSDTDLGAIISYLKSLPPADHVLPASRLGVYWRIRRTFDRFPLASERIDHTRRKVSAPPPEPTAAYGAYVASNICTWCHGENLSGGTHHNQPGGPPSPNLAVVGTWTHNEFTRLMRTGVTPGGHNIWPERHSEVNKHMTDLELEAIYLHLRTLPSRTEK